jgi:Putative zinc-finger
MRPSTGLRDLLIRYWRMSRTPWRTCRPADTSSASGPIRTRQVRRAFAEPVSASPFACRDLVELVTDYLDGVLPPAVQEAAEAHLRGCDGCTAYARQIRLAVDAMRATPAPVLDPRFCARLQAAFRTWSGGRDQIGDGP